MKNSLNKLLTEAYGSLTEPAFLVLLFMTVTTILSGAFVYQKLESWSFIDSLYFTVVTLTTVGYGDMYPVIDAGKMFTIIYLFIGIAIFLGFINLVAGRVSKRWFG
jgi:voltage-gated potassium channel Kch